MSVHQFKTEQFIQANIKDVWEFISSPKNLKNITPASMNFEILSQNLPKKMYAGMIISYMVSPIPLMRVNWVTEITHVDEQNYFVDEQRKGPFKLWHHQHKIQELPNGVLMQDIVTYQPPFGIFGELAQILFINKQLKAIFNFREKAIVEFFGK